MLTDASVGDAHAYGDDPLTERASAELRDLSGAQEVLFVFTGTAANVLGISLLVRPFEGVICAESAHLNIDECGAAERVLGTKLLPVPVPDGKLTPRAIASRLGGRHDEHRVQPAAVAITQATELGTCYSIEELAELARFCRQEGLRVYMDGARLANAAASLGCELRDLSSQVDILSVGGTKNGAVGAEAVLVMDAQLTASAPYLRKQQMQLASKMRYLAAQFIALLSDDLWLRNAGHANEMAARLGEEIAGLPGVELWQPVQSNAVFATLDPVLIEELQQDWSFHVWDEAAHVVRWMTAYDTTEADVDQFVLAIRQAVTGAGAGRG